jgi:hypothetical protein
MHLWRELRLRPLARVTIVMFQLLKIPMPKRFTSSAVLHRLLEWNMRTWLSPNANLLFFRHFHMGRRSWNSLREVLAA